MNISEDSVEIICFVIEWHGEVTSVLVAFKELKQYGDTVD